MRGRVNFPNAGPGATMQHDSRCNSGATTSQWRFLSSWPMRFAVLQSTIAVKHNDILETFDAHRHRIHEVAATVYARGARGSYDLQANDF